MNKYLEDKYKRNFPEVSRSKTDHTELPMNEFFVQYSRRDDYEIFTFKFPPSEVSNGVYVSLDKRLVQKLVNELRGWFE